MCAPPMRVQKVVVSDLLRESLSEKVGMVCDAVGKRVASSLGFENLRSHQPDVVKKHLQLDEINQSTLTYMPSSGPQNNSSAFLRRLSGTH